MNYSIALHILFFELQITEMISGLRLRCHFNAITEKEVYIGSSVALKRWKTKSLNKGG